MLFVSRNTHVLTSCRNIFATSHNEWDISHPMYDIDTSKHVVVYSSEWIIVRMLLCHATILMTLNSEIAWWCECLAYLPPNDLNYSLECETTAQTFTGTLKEIRFEEMMDHYFVKNLWIYFVTAESGQFWPNPADSGWVRLNLVESGWIWLSPAESGWVRLSPGWVRGESGWVRVSPGESGWIPTESIIYN